MLARAYFGSAQLAKSEDALTRLVELAPGERVGPPGAGPHAGAAEPGGRRRGAPPDGRRPRRRLSSQRSAAVVPDEGEGFVRVEGHAAEQVERAAVALHLRLRVEEEDPGLVLQVDDVRCTGRARLQDRERAGGDRRQARGERQHLDRDVRPVGRRGQPLELSPQDRRAAVLTRGGGGPPEDGLVEHRPELQRPVGRARVEDVLPAAAHLHAPVDLHLRRRLPGRQDHLPDEVGALQQGVRHQCAVAPERPRPGLEPDEVGVAGRQRVGVGVPPALGPRGGGEAAQEGRVRRRGRRTARAAGRGRRSRCRSGRSRCGRPSTRDQPRRAATSLPCSGTAVRRRRSSRASRRSRAEGDSTTMAGRYDSRAILQTVCPAAGSGDVTVPVPAPAARLLAGRTPDMNGPRTLAVDYDLYEVAYLAGGPRRAVDAAAVALVESGRVTRRPLERSAVGRRRAPGHARGGGRAGRHREPRATARSPRCGGGWRPTSGSGPAPAAGARRAAAPPSAPPSPAPARLADLRADRRGTAHAAPPPVDAAGRPVAAGTSAMQVALCGVARHGRPGAAVGALRAAGPAALPRTGSRSGATPTPPV